MAERPNPPDISGNLRLEYQHPRRAEAVRPAGLRATIAQKAPAEAAQDAVANAKPGRPGAVILISLYEFARAALILVAAAAIWIRAHNPPSSDAAQAMSYAALGGLTVAVALALAAYSLVIGWGLWTLRKWARNILLASSGISSAYWIRHLVITAALSGVQGSRLFHLERQSSYMSAAINVLIFLFLMFAPGIDETFGVKNTWWRAWDD
jgi:hypothetical protein